MEISEYNMKLNRMIIDNISMDMQTYTSICTFTYPRIVKYFLVKALELLLFMLPTML